VGVVVILAVDFVVKVVVGQMGVQDLLKRIVKNHVILKMECGVVVINSVQIYIIFMMMVHLNAMIAILIVQRKKIVVTPQVKLGMHFV
jgi:hypothetical protein